MDERPVVTDSRQRVALELTQVIDGREHRTRIEKPTARTYDLTPYGQCLKVVSDEAGKRARAKLNLRKCGIRPGECGASR